MATLTQDSIRALAGYKPANAPVVTLYLDVDGRRYVRPRDYEMQLDHLLRDARERCNGNTPHEDFRRIEAHVKAGVDRSHARGLAIFSCAGEELWQVIELPVPVRNQLVVNQAPHVKQLERVLDRLERFAVLMVDRQRARIFEFEMGELVDKSELFDQLPRHDDDKGDWDKDHVRDHAAVLARQHVRRAAHVAFAVYQERPFDHLIIAAPDDLTHEMEKELHSYLRDRIAARLSLPINAPDAAIRSAAIDVEADIASRREAAIVEKLRAASGQGKAVVGLPAVLTALGERRVERLVVSDGYEAPGFRCSGCGFLAAKGRACGQCGGTMDRSDDVVEDAVEEALTQSCKLTICSDNADLDVLGRIGALLRY